MLVPGLIACTNSRMAIRSPLTWFHFVQVAPTITLMLKRIPIQCVIAAFLASVIYAVLYRYLQRNCQRGFLGLPRSLPC